MNQTGVSVPCKRQVARPSTLLTCMWIAGGMSRAERINENHSNQESGCHCRQPLTERCFSTDVCYMNTHTKKPHTLVFCFPLKLFFCSKWLVNEKGTIIDFHFEMNKCLVQFVMLPPVWFPREQKTVCFHHYWMMFKFSLSEEPFLQLSRAF